MRNNIFAHFCGGETIAACAKTTEVLDAHHIGTILDYSIEGKESEKDFSRTCEEVLQTIRTAENNDNIPFCVFKVTGIARLALLEKVNRGGQLSDAEASEFQKVRERVDRICSLAHRTGTPLFIDAEESWIQDSIDHMCEEMMRLYNSDECIVYNTLQMYRHDRLDFLKKSHERAKEEGYKIGFKLVRGAYMEKERDRARELHYPSPIHASKADSDHDYDLALTYCIENINDISICAGSHNEHSALHLVDLMKKHGIEKTDKRIYFAQLYGMSDHISFNLSNEGYNVAKYVPYGPINDVIPYLIRRAEENTSVKGQTGRELNLIVKELKRRKSISN
jgi:proline dehydrogenase